MKQITGTQFKKATENLRVVYDWGTFEIESLNEFNEIKQRAIKLFKEKVDDSKLLLGTSYFKRGSTANAKIFAHRYKESVLYLIWHPKSYKLKIFHVSPTLDTWNRGYRQ